MARVPRMHGASASHASTSRARRTGSPLYHVPANARRRRGEESRAVMAASIAMLASADVRHADARGCRPHRRARAPRADRGRNHHVHPAARRHPSLRRAGAGGRHVRCPADVARPRGRAGRARRHCRPVPRPRRRAGGRTRRGARGGALPRAAGHRLMADFSSVERLAAATRAGALSATEACRAALDAIAATDAGIHAFVHLDAERALGRAADLDRLPSSSRGVLHGVPIALKDNLCTRGGLTTAASKILAGYRPPYDATVVTRLEQAGAIVVGKTNCDEFAMGSSTENSALGPTRNPVDPTRTPGGSSGGSAAAVAAGMVPASLGSDTGGSIRQPAGLCGVVGLKPTYGRVSRYGLLAFASSLDQIGPFTHTVADAALLLGVLAGPDRMDATAADVAISDYSDDLGRGLEGVRVGVARELLEGVDPDVGAAFEASLAAMQAGGASLVAIDLPHATYAIPVYYLVATAEASSNLARYDGVRYGYRA